MPTSSSGDTWSLRRLWAPEGQRPARSWLCGLRGPSSATEETSPQAGTERGCRREVACWETCRGGGLELALEGLAQAYEREGRGPGRKDRHVQTYQGANEDGVLQKRQAGQRRESGIWAGIRGSGAGAGARLPNSPGSKADPETCVTWSTKSETRYSTPKPRPPSAGGRTRRTGPHAHVCPRSGGQGLPVHSSGLSSSRNSPDGYPS